jgi:hypothetical protein
MYTSTLLLALLPAAFAAPLIVPREGKLIPGKYIVKMNAGASKEELEQAKKLLSRVDFEYDFNGFVGFAGSAPSDGVAPLQKLDAVSLAIQILGDRYSDIWTGRMDPSGRRSPGLGLAL